MAIESKGYPIPEEVSKPKYWQLSRLIAEHLPQTPPIPDDGTITEYAKKQLEAFLTAGKGTSPTYVMVQGETFNPDERDEGTVVQFQKEKITLEGLEKQATLTTDDYQNSSLWGVICSYPVGNGAQRAIVPFVNLSADGKLHLIPNPLIARPIRVGEVFREGNALTKINTFSVHQNAF